MIGQAGQTGKPTHFFAFGNSYKIMNFDKAGDSTYEMRGYAGSFIHVYQNNMARNL